ncbi:ABC transporter permease [Parathalassolituus penaei]|uniref:ABC transporter permease n=1 Tax=Parathalassolituus penaei TaxID=2997323 RepID=A0A9X3IQG6_9GAMM|nr:FtsX-like permease family protein [Parathalassolituus penaei]MCY0963771.1 ABC transporter permease [Parathalassolituus penaei]
MTINKWLALSWLNLIRNGRRSLISGGVIAFGSAALLLSIGYVSATFEGLRESTIQGGLGHLQIAAHNGFDDPRAEAISAAQAQQLEQQLQAMPEVRLTTRRILFEGLASSGDVTIAVMGRGVDIDQERKISLFTPIVEGRNLSGQDSGWQAVIGDRLARNLGVSVGDSLTLLTNTRYQGINAIDVTIKGINRSGIPELDERSVMISLAAASLLTDSDQVSRLVVGLYETANTDLIADRLQADTSISVQRWIDLFPFYGAVVNLYHSIFGMMGGIILVVVFLSVSNSMLMAFMERVNESGTLRAFGFSRGRVIGLFSAEGWLLGALGASAGLEIGLLLMLLINQASIPMPPPPGRSVGYPLVLNVEVLAVPAILAAMMLCGTLAAWLPARRMTAMTITAALNHY